MQLFSPQLSTRKELIQNILPGFLVYQLQIVGWQNLLHLHLILTVLIFCVSKEKEHSLVLFFFAQLLHFLF